MVTPDEPGSLAISETGDLKIADGGRKEIFERMPSGRYRVVAGTGVAGLTDENEGNCLTFELVGDNC
jgi:hypothetical protein